MIQLLSPITGDLIDKAYAQVVLPHLSIYKFTKIIFKQKIKTAPLETLPFEVVVFFEKEGVLKIKNQ